MKKVHDLDGAELALLVAKIRKLDEALIVDGTCHYRPHHTSDDYFYGELVPWAPHENWGQGGPIIEREGISFKQGEDGSCYAYFDHLDETASGPTPLIAAMRAYVKSKFGDEVQA